MVDARKYASKYIKPDQVRDGPLTTRIIHVYEDERYTRLNLELENGSTFGLNDSNANTLINAWGSETDSWIGQEITFVLGTYRDFKTGEDKETVKVLAIPSAKAAAGNGGEPSKPALPPSRVGAGGAHPSLRDDPDDSIPFGPEWR